MKGILLRMFLFFFPILPIAKTDICKKINFSDKEKENDVLKNNGDTINLNDNPMGNLAFISLRVNYTKPLKNISRHFSLQFIPIMRFRYFILIITTTYGSHFLF